MNKGNNIPKVNEEYDVTIESEGTKGDGVTKINGFVVFIPETKIGENVRIRITKVTAKYGFGEVIQEEE